VHVDTETYKRIVAAKLFIDENFHEPIHLEQISQQAYFSRFHFHRMFTRIYRRTPHIYLTSKRLEKAKRLLEQEGVSIQEVCNSVGFESLASFSLLFSKHEGVAPQYYRNLAYIKNKLAKEHPQRLIPNCIVQNVVAPQTSIDQ
jgi:AraC-like DNA-binding protein